MPNKAATIIKLIGTPRNQRMTGIMKLLRKSEIAGITSFEFGSSKEPCEWAVPNCFGDKELSQ